MLQKYLSEEILSFAEERGINLTEHELQNAISGVEFWLTSTLPDSIDTAISNIQYDRARNN